MQRKASKAKPMLCQNDLVMTLHGNNDDEDAEVAHVELRYVVWRLVDWSRLPALGVGAHIEMVEFFDVVSLLKTTQCSSW